MQTHRVISCALRYTSANSKIKCREVGRECNSEIREINFSIFISDYHGRDLIYFLSRSIYLVSLNHYIISLCV